jgi:hypothetical protein
VSSLKSKISQIYERKSNLHREIRILDDELTSVLMDFSIAKMVLVQLSK